MYLIRQLASKYKITRTALLHYDAINLLSPKERNKAGYRLYSGDDERRLQKIILFRSMGLSLDTIKHIVVNDTSKLANILLTKLDELNGEIKILKERQKNILDLLGNVRSIERYFSFGTMESRNQDLFHGIDPAQWHKKFEELSPDNHKLLLKISEKIPEKDKNLILKFLITFPTEIKTTIMKVIKKNP